MQILSFPALKSWSLLSDFKRNAVCAVIHGDSLSSFKRFVLNSVCIFFFFLVYLFVLHIFKGAINFWLKKFSFVSWVLVICLRSQFGWRLHNWSIRAQFSSCSKSLKTYTLLNTCSKKKKPTAAEGREEGGQIVANSLFMSLFSKNTCKKWSNYFEVHWSTDPLQNMLRTTGSCFDVGFVNVVVELT